MTTIKDRITGLTRVMEGVSKLAPTWQIDQRAEWDAMHSQIIERLDDESEHGTNDTMRKAIDDVSLDISDLLRRATGTPDTTDGLHVEAAAALLRASDNAAFLTNEERQRLSDALDSLEDGNG